ncbi:MAG TPA: transmembrane 220 family protein, partial [Kofleriaceae bacterium]|nr:transmembrane 220 family protein [Kofleriaceae bacterium]
AQVRYRRRMSEAPVWFRTTSWVMAALYAVSVALQYNDPDPLRWMAIYGAAAVASAMLPTRRFAVPLALATAGAALLWAALLFPEIWGRVGFTDLWKKMSEKGGAVEIEREIGGLAIVVCWLLPAALLRHRDHRTLLKAA